MTVLLIYLVVLILAAAALMFCLWLLRREPEPIRFSQVLPGARRHPDFYLPMTRLFTSRDIAFLRDQKGFRAGMNRRLRRERRRVLTLYLGEARRDFRNLERACRLLARRTHNWELASLVHRQRVVFCGLFLVLRVRCLLASVVFVQVDTGALLAMLRGLERNLRLFATRVDARAAA